MISDWYTDAAVRERGGWDAGLDGRNAEIHRLYGTESDGNAGY